MKLLSVTGGGSTKGAGLYGICKSIMKSWQPNVICWMSVSAIFSIPLAMNIDVSENLIYSSKKEIFGKYKPVNEKGNPSIRVVFRMLLGRSMGKQDALKETIKQIITEEVFKQYCYATYNGYAPEIDVVFVNYNKAKVQFQRLSKVCYEEAINYTNFI